MTRNSAVITVASWEDRFLLGTRRLLARKGVGAVLMFYYKEYADRTAESRGKVQRSCAERGKTCLPRELSFADPAGTWGGIRDAISEVRKAHDEVLVDITTMPREAIWTTLRLLTDGGARIGYVYHKPKSYSRQWVSRDPGKPRLVFKMSGQTKSGAPTFLFIVTGYDTSRVNQLIRAFEPASVVLATQVGAQFDNQDMNVGPHKARFGSFSNVGMIDVDAYSSDHGFAAIRSNVEPQIAGTNVVMASLGPKLSAIALFRIQRVRPEVALAYAPSNEFNVDYSHGLGETVEGQLGPEECADERTT